MKLVLNSPQRISRQDLPHSPPTPSPTAVFATEANHRISNNLGMVAAMLRMHADAVRRGDDMLSPGEAGEIIDQAGARIDVVAQLHRLLAAEDSGTVRLGEYLERIAENVIDSMSHRDQVVLVIACEGNHALDSTLAVRIGFIVNELVTNVIKYAHPACGVRGRLELGCEKRPDGALHIRVADDGVGLPEEFDPVRDGGLGMRTVRTIARQIDAGLSFDSSDLGLEVSLMVPAAKSTH